MTNPKVSIIMSVYNGEPYLSESIFSILSQTFTDYEFIIIDDGSTDNSLNIIKSFNDPRIKLLINKKNIGLTDSLNRGIFCSDGEYIARQDADDISMPKRIEKQVKYLDNHSDVALLGTSYYTIDKNSFVMEMRHVHVNPAEDILNHNTFIHGSVMFRRCIIKYVGKYNTYFKYAQDYEFWRRISKLYKVANLSDPLYQLRYIKTSVTAKNYMEQALYVLKAQRMDSCFDVSKLQYETLFPYEKSILHNMIAYNFVQSDDIISAKKEYFISLKMDPFNLESIFGYIFSAMGKKYILWIYNIYRKIRNHGVY